MIHRSRWPDVDIPDVPLTEYVLAGASQNPQRVAFVDGDSGTSLTLGALAEETARVAGGLAGRGFERGDVLATVLPNVPEYFPAFHGVATVGGTVTPVNPSYSGEELAFQLRDAGARFAVTVPALAPGLVALRGTTPLETVFVVGDPVPGTEPFGDLLAGEPHAQAPVDLRHDVVALPYSSGTTGLPKGVMLTHRNLVANLAQLPPCMDLQAGDSTLAVLPFFHIYGLTVVMNYAIKAGATVVTMPRFDLEQFLRLIEERRVTTLYLAPPIVLALAKHPLVDQFDLSSVRWIISGAAPLGADVAAEAAARVGCPVAQGYGMTELSPVSHTTGTVGITLGSIGAPISNTEVRIVDPATGRDLGIDEDGELRIRGPQVMKGYLGNDQATDEMIDEGGWLRTGDIGRVDANGDCFVVDRLKELIKVKGFQVAPAELEALLLRHPGVADCAVIGVPDDEAGERPRAFVVPRHGVDLEVTDVLAFVAEQVARYKHLRDVVFIEKIPKSPSGKILRRELRA